MKIENYINVYQETGAEYVLLKPQYEATHELVVVLSENRDYIAEALIYQFASPELQKEYNAQQLRGYVDDETAEADIAFEQKLIDRIMWDHNLFWHDAGRNVEILAVERK